MSTPSRSSSAGPNDKEELYKAFLGRLEAAVTARNFLEASWYAYAILEDRLRSLMRSSGGEGRHGPGKPVRMMGNKLDALKQRARTDALLKANFEYDRLNKWKDDRNDLMHAMADASKDLGSIDAMAEGLAEEGAKLVRTYSAACRRMKKHRAKVQL